MRIQSVLRRKVDVLLKAIALNQMCVSPKMILLFYLVNNVLVIIPTLLAFYSSRRDNIAAMFPWLEILALLEALIILANFRYYRSRMQPILKEADKRASIITTTFGVIVALYTASIIIYIYRPAVSEWDGMLTTAYYPASMRSPFADVFIYITQLTALLHNGVLIVSDAFTVLLLYVCTVRLEVLQKNFPRVADYGFTPTDTIVSFQLFALVIAMNAMRLFFSATFADDLSNSLINYFE
ncbi:hypothetical protein TSAR_006556 [Trichomalopsis sarcophagae]|uniref:Odorant receptor n=1 Tax=Trichomalopsis sarcophagae TaxID=543379 RepID=A0A232FED4_9HYME|nr:hypothetical protein TSAR_006556 [Trichomalopsis sarcophagae]